MLRDLKVRLLLMRAALRARARKLLRLKSKKSMYGLPRPVQSGNPQHGIAIVTIVKNEAAYIMEWAEFHFMLGVKHIFVYDNGSVDNTREVLTPYVRELRVTIVPWFNFSQVLHPQNAAYAHAVANFVVDYRWVAFIDVDEFMFPARGDNLDATFAELEEQPAVCLPWLNFGPSGHEKRPKGLVIANYTERAVFPPRRDQYSLLRYKTVVNPREVVSVNTHRCNLRGKGPVLINDAGQELPDHQMRDTSFPTIQKLRLHHYFTRSIEEIAERVAKGRVSRGGSVNEQFIDRRLTQYNRAIETDTSILRFVPELERRLAARLGAEAAAAE